MLLFLIMQLKTFGRKKKTLNMILFYLIQLYHVIVMLHHKNGGVTIISYKL